MLKIELPAEVPGMTLSNTVLFPHAILPLYIFEDRYRRMVRDVLGSHRIFLVAHQINEPAHDVIDSEPAHQMATAGIIRMCSHNADGTSNLMLQGLTRVKIDQIVSDEPYRTFAVTPVASTCQSDTEIELAQRQAEFLKLVEAKEKLGSTYPPEIHSIFEKLQNVDMLADLASHIFCRDDSERQKLLETIDSHKRIDLLMKNMRKDVASLRLNRKLQGQLNDDDIPSN
ncbi:MAG: LON peptidase substrate-binding domain-containing protein [Verrucomicrobiota bacterium]